MTVATINAGQHYWVDGRDATYATAHSTRNDVQSYSAEVGQKWTALIGYQIWRLFLKFDTSSIPVDAVISSVTMKLAVTSDQSVNDFDVVIKKHDWSATDPVTYGNGDTAYDAVLASAADDNIWRNTSGMSINTYYTSGELDISHVDVTGTTYYGVMSSRDISSTTPPGGEKLVFDIVTNVPQLVVVYTVPAASGPQAAFISDYGII